MGHCGRTTVRGHSVAAETKRCNGAWVGLEDVLRTTAAAVRRQAAGKRLTLRMSMPPDLPFVRADAEQLLQLFAALLSEAVENTPDDGQVSLDVERGDRCAITLLIGGTGNGLSGEEIEAATKPFARFASCEIDQSCGPETCVTLRWPREAWLANPRQFSVAPGFW